MSRIVTYILTVIIVGLLLSSITNIVLEYIPFVVAGIVTVSPFYGMFRKLAKKGQSARGIKSLVGIIPRFFKLNKNSVGFYGILAIVTFFLYKKIATVLVQTVVMSTLAVGVIFIIWEGLRICLKAIKRIEILSFIEAVKSSL